MTRARGKSSFAIWTRRLVYAVLVLVLLMTGVLLGVIWYKPSPIQVALAGESRDLGTEYGRKLRTPMQLVTRFYLDRIVCQGSPKLMEGSRAAALRSMPNWPAPYPEELNATAAAARIPVG